MSERSIVVEGHDFTYRVGRTHVVIRRSDRASLKVSVAQVKGINPDLVERGRWKGTNDGSVTPKEVASYIREHVLGLPKAVDPKPMVSAPSTKPAPVPAAPKFVHLLHGTRYDPATIDGTQTSLIGVSEDPGELKDLQKVMEKASIAEGLAELQEPYWNFPDKIRERAGYASDEDFVRKNVARMGLWQFELTTVVAGTVLFNPFKSAEAGPSAPAAAV